jgi:hydrogenase nickel incorporation protein HypA/HybF
MHELSVTESILDITLHHAAQANAKRVTAIYLVIGQLSSIVDDSVSFYWDIISKGTLAEGAGLHFQRIATEMQCLACNQRYQPNNKHLACPHCGSYQVKVIAGEEFYLESIEVETAEMESERDVGS